MKRIKNQMLSDELAGFEFTAEMQRQVLNKIEEKHGRKRHVLKPLLPISLTAAFLVVSSAGIYHITTTQNQSNPHSEGPTAEEKEEKPVISLYVPEGYELKHTKTIDDVYEQLYVNKNTNDTFSYRMQNKEQTYPEGTKNSIRLSQNLEGTMIRGQDITALTWEHDGSFHVLEQKGSMGEIDFLKISYSILIQQDLGPYPYLGDEVEGLETEIKEKENLEKPDDVITETDEEDTEKEYKEDEIPTLTEGEAIEILRRFEEIKNKVYHAPEDLRIAGFNTKEQFYEAFKEVMVRKEAERKFGYRITEQENGLYIVPMDGLQDWVFNVPPDEFTRINEKKYTISQYLEDDLNGHGPFPVTFEYLNGQWLITSYGRVFD